MNRMYEKKDLLTVEEAVRYLSFSVGDSVSLADLYRAVLDKHLTISVEFLSQACARCGQYILSDNGVDSELVFELPTQVINDTWDLAMIGRETQEIEVLYQKEVGGRTRDFTGLNGFFLKGGESIYKLERSLLLDGSEDHQNAVLSRINSLLEPTGLTIDDIKPSNSPVLNGLNGDELEEIMDLDSLLTHIELGEHKEGDAYLPLEARYQHVIKNKELKRFIRFLKGEDKVAEQCSLGHSLKDCSTNLAIIRSILKSSGFDYSARGISTSIKVAFELTGVILSYDTIKKVMTSISQGEFTSAIKGKKSYFTKERNMHLVLIGGMLKSEAFDFSPQDIIPTIKDYLESNHVTQSDDSIDAVLTLAKVEFEKRLAKEKEKEKVPNSI